jgi:allantoin racemase
VIEFRLALINPNSNSEQTEAMRRVAQDALGERSEVHAATAINGPRSIESAVDDVVASPEILELIGSMPDMNGYLIACFGDPALDAAREVTKAPVVGIGEAAYIAATQTAKRFAVLTTLARGVPELEDTLERHGLTRRCVGVIPVGVPVAEQSIENEVAYAALLEKGKAAILERGAEALVLACGGMADAARTVSRELGVPVCDGVAFGALLVYALFRSGLQTSKVGAYEWPPGLEAMANP